MPKTPDDIKKGLEICLKAPFNGCNDCVYDAHNCPECVEALVNDALALIQQLEAENAEKDGIIRELESGNNAMYHTILGVMHFVDKWLDVPAYDPDEDLKGTTAVGRASQAREIALHAIEQLEAERDAAVVDIRLAFTSYVGACQTCKHGVNQIDCRAPLRCGDCENEKCRCQSCDEYERNWEWRGVQKEVEVAT